MDLDSLLQVLIPSWEAVSVDSIAVNQYSLFSMIYTSMCLRFSCYLLLRNQVAILFIFFFYLAIAGSVLPGRIIPGVILSDRTRLQYRCNGIVFS